MAQTLLLGLGGTGMRIVNNVAAELRKKGTAINDGQICCAVLDTNDNDRKKVSKTNTGIPVIGTSREWTIKEYLGMYVHKGVKEWMPESPGLKTETITDGAAQMRVKSRLAFMDAVYSRSLSDLEAVIDKMFDERDDAKIRVMIVSSLSGGTGSGMFIQTALWLRKFFERKKCSVTMRGIFLLPDVFVRTIDDIRNDATETMSQYANAYAAIRELNAITKVKKFGDPTSMPIKIDNLFDSEADQGEGHPVFDYAFFIDDVADRGSVLANIRQYEEVVARLVYMQLYAPMHDDLYSEEDNLFKRFEECREPVYGSCGTARAVYPYEDILRYCALRASQDSLSSGWRKIDNEIKGKQRKEEEKIKNGAILQTRIDPRSEFIRIFENKSQKTGNQIGSDRLFVNIANDIKNEKKSTDEEGRRIIDYTDKIGDFLDKLNVIISTKIDTENPGKLKEIRLKSAWGDAYIGEDDGADGQNQTSNVTDDLIKLVEKKTKAVKRFVEAVDESAGIYAEDIMNSVFPADMSEINQDDADSIYGLMTKKDENENTYFIHPVASRYLLYKLLRELKKVKDSIDVDKARDAAIKGHGGGKRAISFDNPRTKIVESAAIDYLKSKKRSQNESKFIKDFIDLYSQHNGGQAELCRTFAVNTVKYRVAIMLSERLEKLVKIIEKFFADLELVSGKLNDELAENIEKNKQVQQKTIFICASEKDKRSLYDSLRIDVEASNTTINRMVMNALYGKLCAEEYPEMENNIEYKEKSVEGIFFVKLKNEYEHIIKSNYEEQIDLDIYTAICKSSDIAYEEERKAEQESQGNGVKPNTLDFDEETGTTRSSGAKKQRHIEAMEETVKKLLKLGSPCLITDNEQPDDPDEHLKSDADNNDDEEEFDEFDEFTPVKKHKTFWGFNPVVAAKCPELGQILGVNVASQQNSAYDKNVLECYRAVYGVMTKYVVKFNELAGGDYYKNYRQVVRKMIERVGQGDEAALVSTPHIDKTWHLFMPYVTKEMQEHEDARFFRLFWLAFAYGMITVTKGKYRIKRKIKTALGSNEVYENIKLNGRSINVTDVVELIAALKLDGKFMIDAVKCEKQFEKECDLIVNYEGTEFLRGKSTKDPDTGNKVVIGGLASKDDVNAVTLIIRYCNSPRSRVDVISMLINSLERLCMELVKGNYDPVRQKNGIKRAGYELCKRIYNASAMRDKDNDIIKDWKRRWSQVEDDD